jgi:uncharacterized protein YndB with AHSA1/START domain
MDESRVSPAVLSPIVKYIFVGLSLNASFRLFTVDIDRWWPLETHSVGGKNTLRCVLEGQVGGRFYEVQVDGSRSEWGIVRIWEPDRRIVLSFYPGRTPEFATEVEVTFTSEVNGTRVTLIHRGWDTCPPEMQARHDSYVHGWDQVLSNFVKASQLYDS